MATVWYPAHQAVIDIAKELIRTHHKELQDARIAFIMRDFAPVSNGRQTMGKARKVTPEQQVHIKYDFVIWLAQNVWNELTALQKTALIDHELSHCSWDEESGASMLGHDIEEFAHIIERYGFWWPHSGNVQNAMQQAMLLPTEPRQSNGTVEAMPVGWMLSVENVQ